MIDYVCIFCWAVLPVVAFYVGLRLGRGCPNKALSTVQPVLEHRKRAECRDELAVSAIKYVQPTSSKASRAEQWERLVRAVQQCTGEHDQLCMRCRGEGLDPYQDGPMTKACEKCNGAGKNKQGVC